MPGSLLPCLPSMVEAALSKTRILINGQVRGRRWQQPVAHSPSCFGLALCSLPPSLPPSNLDLEFLLSSRQHFLPPAPSRPVRPVPCRPPVQEWRYRTRRTNEGIVHRVASTRSKPQTRPSCKFVPRATPREGSSCRCEPRQDTVIVPQSSAPSTIILG